MGSRYLLARALKKASRSSGDVTVNSTAWTNLDTTLDLTLAATVGDEIEVGVCGVWANEAVEGMLNVATIVSGAVVNTVGPTGASDYGLLGWYGSPSTYAPIGAPALYTVVAGDLASGYVTLRLRTRTATASNKTLRASSTLPFRWHAKNVGPADPN